MRYKTKKKSQLIYRREEYVKARLVILAKIKAELLADKIWTEAEATALSNQMIREYSAEKIMRMAAKETEREGHESHRQ